MNINSQQYNTSQQRILWFTYGLYALIIPTIIGVIIDIAKTKEYKKLTAMPDTGNIETVTMLASHHIWLSRTFFITLVSLMVAAGTFYYGFGIIIAFGTGIWWIYRITRGIWSLSHHKAVPVWV